MNLKSISKYMCFLLLTQLLFSAAYSQNDKPPYIESFEDDSVLEKYDIYGGKLGTSETHKMFGKKSLKWVWTEENSYFSTSHFSLLTHDESPLVYGDFFPASPALLISIYNEKPQEGQVKISYYQDDIEKVWFHINLNFRGWRKLRVPFHELNGTPPKKGIQVNYNHFKITTNTKSGTLFFDDIIFSQYQDDRYAYPDYLVPFIKRNTNLGSDHWMPLISNYKAVKTLKPKEVSEQTKQDLSIVEKNIDKELIGSKKTYIAVDKLQKRYAALHLKKEKGYVNGPPLTYRIKEEYYDSIQQGEFIHNDIKDFGKLLKDIALSSNNTTSQTEKAQLESMFLEAIQYFLDQGWQAGASGSTRHHIGYAIRDFTEAVFIMRHALKSDKSLKPIGESLQWLYNLGMVLDNEENFHVNIDYLNTQAYYHLMLIFLTDNKEKQSALLSTYSNYTSIILAQEDQEWGFKIDGTSWHHNGHYPAYGMGAFTNTPRIIYALSQTKYRIREAGHKNFKKAFLTTGKYSQLYDYGFGNAGRHPLEDGNIKSLKSKFLLMAYSGNPENTLEIDPDVASAYLRLWGAEDSKSSKNFNQAGIKKEKLNGYFTLPYAATAIHRKSNWAAIIKGYSKYVWSSEIYVASNRYGRYPANGTIQILNKKGEKGSGFKQEGWDWNRYPGATVINLKLKELEASLPLLMFRSEETFAGAIELKENGVFSMILDESAGSNADGDNQESIGFPGKLKAKKSVFSFNDKLICIGSNISSIDHKNHVQTNLFQSYLKRKEIELETSSGTISSFPFKTDLKSYDSSGKWLIDPYGNGYHILSTNQVEVQKKTQHSYHNKYSINTGMMDKKAKETKETTGDYGTAWINHGLAPKNSSYSYVIYPDIKSAQNLQKSIKNASYIIEQADSIAHIVTHKKTNITGYAIFEADQDLNDKIIKKVSEPSLLMIESRNKEIVISAVVPDLNFKQNKNLSYVNNSRQKELIITLKGKWSCKENAIIQYSNDQTNLIINSVHGLPEIFTLFKK